MATSRIFAGMSGFFANKANNFNWIDNVKRPMLNVINTAADGVRSYHNLFFSNDSRVTLDKTAGRSKKITIPANHAYAVWPLNFDKPLFKEGKPMATRREGTE